MFLFLSIIFCKAILSFEYQNPFNSKTLEYLLFEKCWIDTVQWHLEDFIRKPNLNPKAGLEIKKRIDIYNKIRGLSPFPGSRTTISSAKGKNKNVIIYDSDYIVDSHNLENGRIINEKGVIEEVITKIDTKNHTQQILK